MKSSSHVRGDMMRRFAPSALVGLAALMLAPGPGGFAQSAPVTVAAPDAVAIDTALGDRYRRGGVHRFLFGTRYRGLWTTPVRVAVLDLRRVAGGLRPLERSGERSVESVRFVGADGRDYVLRAADPDAPDLPPELQSTLISQLFQDQISAVHPFGPLVADRLGGAVGLPRLRPRLVVVPNDPLLGEFREDLAGRVGYLQELLTTPRDGAPGFAGFREIIGTEELLRRRRERPAEAVDARRFLAARLLDLLLGDWDRRRGQWRWGRADPRSAWQPIPRDRDHTFSQYDGLLPSLARGGPAPYLVRFGEGRLPVAGLIWYSRDLDREILPRLERPVWDSVTAEVRSRLTDAAIDSAVAEMPSGVSEASREWLAAALRARRSRLADASRRFYRTLAIETDLHGTDAAERIVAVGEPGGGLRMEIAGLGAGTRVSRRFEPAETREVRVFAHGGADTVVSRGAPSRIRVRVVGGHGKDVLRREGGPRIPLIQDGADWRPLPGESDRPPPQDWGGRTSVLPLIGINSDAGFVVGARLTHEDFGFRKLPFASQTQIKTAFGTISGRPGIALASTVQTARPWLRFVMDAKVTGVEALRFYTPGNESPEAEDRDFHMVRNWQVELAPAVELSPTGDITFGIGPRMRYVRSQLSADRLVGTARPYGGGEFGGIGAAAYARWDLLDVPSNPARGLMLEVGADVMPALWHVEETFGSAHAILAGFLRLPAWSGPTLHLRAGARRVWGRYPYFEAARIGGGASVRGYTNGRFLGDASVFGQTEIRVPVAGARLIVPGTLGILGLADVGRVFVDGQRSEVWHAGFGGGLWFAWLGGAKVFSLTVARGAERTTLSFRTGIGF